MFESIFLMDIASVLSGANATYLLNLLEQYRINPDSVDSNWIPVLEELSKGYGALEEKPTWGEKIQTSDIVTDSGKTAKKATSQKEILDSMRALLLIEAYRTNGHLKTKLDPLNLSNAPLPPLDLDPKTYGFNEHDYNTSIFVNGAFGQEQMTLNELLIKLQSTYCSHLSIEYMHIQNLKEREWIKEKIENSDFKFDTHRQKWILNHLTKAEFFEKFIHVKFPGAKRFGLDGGESLIPALQYIIEKKSSQGVLEFVFGMPHRGRLSTLVNVLTKPMRYLFAQFEGISSMPDGMESSGDVKYHLGYSCDVSVQDKKVHLSLLANPSHLEAVDPLVLGKVRSRQDKIKDYDRKKIIGLMMHGDASFAGQGIVAETLNLCGLNNYKTGGTIHIIVNNQIGFTTKPECSRSTPYSTDISKFIQVPIFHIDGDNPESVIKAMDLACDYHNQFKKDVIIDLVCYRRYGHNEGDEPLFTQPQMYKKIQNHPSVRSLYETNLLNKGILQADEAQTLRDNIDYLIKAEFDAVQKAKNSQSSLNNKADWLEGDWKNIKAESKTEILLKPIKTGVDTQVLRALGLKILTPKKDFTFNTKILRQWEQKREALNKGEGVDWSLAESLAFASLLIDNHPVRLSGQDSERGTFSQRHAVLTDQITEEQYTPLNCIQQGQEVFSVVNSPLSEFSVLGYEYGYSLANPNALVMWEAQFGDFANGAQVIVDQFISASEEKWLRLCGLVMLLPHGLEGQGPEHSSARLERYLQLCAQNNMIVANCSTPSNYFHILKRQVMAPYRKPLILITPKSLLRHKQCVSDLKHMGAGTSFMPIIEDSLAKANIERIVLCSGKVYYDLLEKRPNNVAIIRLEQFYPFPETMLLNLLNLYPKVPVIWCQEEPQNMGAWHFLDRRLEKVLTQWQGQMVRPIYIGRPDAASPATGFASKHNAEQAKLVKDALGI